jgi:hypothetical protein
MHPCFTFLDKMEVDLKFRKLSNLTGALFKKRTSILYVLLAFVFSGVLRSGDQFTTLLAVYTAMFWVYSYAELRRKYHRPRNPETKATLKVSTEPFVDWAVTNMQGDLVVSGWGNRTLELPSTGIRIERDTKVKYSEFTYIVEVTSGNGDAFISLTVDGDDEFLQTVACGRSGDPEVLYTHLNTGYGTKHWLIPGFLQGIPSSN